MCYYPEIHHRRSIHLKEYDYSLPGVYFITICTKNKECLLGEIIDREMKLNDIGKLVQNYWVEIPNHFSNVMLDKFVVMPNHVHGIIIIGDVGATLAVAPSPAITQNQRAGASPAPTSLGQIVGAYKSLCVNHWLKYIKQNKIDGIGKFWQRNYYEHIIRNENELNRIRHYIINNPMNWESDENFI